MRYRVFSLCPADGENFAGVFVDSNSPELLALEMEGWFHWTTLS